MREDLAPPTTQQKSSNTLPYQHSMNMVPMVEFDALKDLLQKIEFDARVKCEQKDAYINGMREEMDRMRNEFAIDFEEFKL